MSVTYTGTFWSGVSRALLSLRRDKHLPTPAEQETLKALSDIESSNYPIEQLNDLLSKLFLCEVPEHIGQSILGYFDFTRMGTIHCYVSMARDISAALDGLTQFNSPLFDASETFTVEQSDTAVKLIITAHYLAEMEPPIVAFLLALFRHIAGREFDFIAIETKYAHHWWPLAPVSKATLTHHSRALVVTFAPQWLNRPSYFYSPKLQSILVKNLQHHSPSNFKHELLQVFRQFPAPAKIRAEAVADAMGLTESVFRRKLRDEKLSFSALLKSHIHEQSVSQLLRGTRIDHLSEQLGFSDRRSFDRSFKEFTGVSPAQLRQIGSRLRFQRGNQALTEITENLPPLPETITEIINLSEQQLGVDKLVTLISADPVFRAHVMGKASRALYGNIPGSLEQAIGRNLGVSNVKYLAVLFAAQQYLTVQSVHPNVPGMIDAMLLSHALFERTFASEYSAEDNALIAQLLLFGPLALLLIFHTEHLDAKDFLAAWQQSGSFNDFIHCLTNEYNLCLYGASTLMLIRWGFTSNVNQSLWRLCQDRDSKVSQRIKFCHSLAFDKLCFNQNTGTLQTDESLFSAQQATTAEDLLNNW
ncbi:helix-turn-helix domain-containing protein [Alteromonas gilva]|uniref:Helix-turn-helix domain-containing protein n=1 Tax=Alteromonas gilva TaxID=2987522 RepID=A0ABT5L3Q4_9ALTE|nr:helix-turn-helix domain-containing protein [Alteromonas gilva]MDC8831659.1 helix-turn-helix domain-containing protein [Alteromonas gilva]